MLWNIGSSSALIDCWSVRRAWQLSCKSFITNRVNSLNPALEMSPRLVMKRLQSNRQARRTDQQSCLSSFPLQTTDSTIRSPNTSFVSRGQGNSKVHSVQFYERLTWNPAESLVWGNALLIRLLKILRQPTTGFALLGPFREAQSPSFRQPYVLLEPKLRRSRLKQRASNCNPKKLIYGQLDVRMAKIPRLRPSGNLEKLTLVSKNTLICKSIWFSRETQINLSFRIFFNWMCCTQAVSRFRIS
ncbi:hypothetical protein CSKR_100316 [Clonorchis sinensis]|uniref:Uncharacterized protein n=1 Tax=Clonorchis sinensis TaxID=79923 RepID=A0A3R7JH01_CLOSI|nr:hypothetical protein CSKR_100316 [Clonorchis sinensis]